MEVSKSRKVEGSDEYESYTEWETMNSMVPIWQRAMQVTGIGSLLLCVVSMFFIYIQLYAVSVYIFGLALVLLIISLTISVYEIYISVKALEIHLNDMDE